MAKIRMLSGDVIGKIAAGEVVERPAAAIKELVENSLDAGAKSIQVEIQEGGIASFRVSDDGCGIEGADIRMAFERHATSKISREEDLNAIGTLGFRGEALASIAAVARVTLVTRTAQEDTGLKVVNEGGRITSLTEAACPVGTSITVKDLFYNVPVRRGFLKKPATETNAVSDLMLRLILSRPDVGFRYLSNGRMVYHSPGDGKIESAVLSLYGLRAVRAMRKVEGLAGGIVMKGYVGIGENARSSRAGESFFINGRMLRSPLLSGALEDACRERVMIGKYPMCALYLEMPYEAVNVNVHPNKMEVRFRDDQAVRQAVFSLVYDALQDRDAFERPVEMPLETPRQERESLRPIPAPNPGRQVRVDIGEAIPDPGKAEGDAPDGGDSFTPRFREEQAAAWKEKAERMASYGRQVPELEPDLLPEPVTESAAEGAAKRQPEAESAPVDAAKKEPAAGSTAEDAAKEQIAAKSAQEHAAKEEPERERTEAEPCAKGYESAPPEQLSVLPENLPKKMRVFGALFDTFILIEYEDHLLLVDQHAVHERLLFDRMMKAYEGHRAGQELLVPLIVSLTKREQAVLEENRELLEGLGLVLEPFGEQEMAVRSVPVTLGENEGAAFVREALDELENGKIPGADKKRAAILQMACKHAVKGGEPLSEAELRDLVEKMIDQKVTPTCPHGRPLVVSISHYELDKKFKRIQ